MAKASRAVSIANGYLGIKEKPPGSNRTIIGEKFGWNGVAWCQEFTSVVCHEAGLKKNTDFPWTASCAAAKSWFQGKKRWHQTPKVGDQVLYSHNGKNGYPYHVELVVKVTANNITTIGGNTSGRAGNINGAGDGCYMKVIPRSRSSISGYGRPNWDGTDLGSGGTDSSGDKDMPSYVSLGAKAPQNLPPGKWSFLLWDVVYSDKTKQHGGKGKLYPSLMTATGYYTATAGFRLIGLPKGATAEVQFCEVEKQKDGTFKVVELNPIQAVTGLGGDLPVTHTNTDFLAKGRRLRIRVKTEAKAVKVKPDGVKILYWGTTK